MAEQNYCIDCGNKTNGKKYCQKCYLTNHNPLNNKLVRARNRTNVSKALTGRKRTKEHSDNISKALLARGMSGGKNPHWKGGKEEYICTNCGEIFEQYKSVNKGKFCSFKCLHEWMKENAPKGDKHSCWQGGISKEPYPFEFDNELKEKIRKRDNYECQLCGMTEEEHLIVYGQVLTIHHIDYNKQNCKEDNLITTCKQCNSRVNFNRKHWEDIFKERVCR